eukprot:TRINITY_DN10315_c0_g1_i3.p1 TRINITY_DN10315_c0_g1~~TRINITY_DN10315_c0_g1_i3.p1  ORF type:complete len:483 (+),score=69.18 TRINITY_DN10315_c0_g1_i3:78-1451(+)
MPRPEQLVSGVAELDRAVQGTHAAAAAARLWRQLAAEGRIPAEAFAALGCHEPAEEPPFVYEYQERWAVPAPELAAGEAPRVDGSVGHDHAAVLTAAGEVWETRYRNIGTRTSESDPSSCDEASLRCAQRVALPWPAAAVRCGTGFSVALRRGGGAVCSWGRRNRKGQLGREGRYHEPLEVSGLPPDDPVVVLAALKRGVIVITARDEAYGWGSNHNDCLCLDVATYPTPTRIPSLCGLGVRRIACTRGQAVAEANGPEGGQLVHWGFGCGSVPVPVPVSPGPHSPIFPLRSLTAAEFSGAAAADASGQLWVKWYFWYKLTRLGIPDGDRALRAAAMFPKTFVVLTATGHLWDLRAGPDSSPRSGPEPAAANWRSITVEQPELPLGLLPVGGMSYSVGLLLRDACCGKARLRTFARIAAHRGVPSDVVRAVLARYMVHEVYMTGPESDPFGWPLVRW